MNLKYHLSQININVLKLLSLFLFVLSFKVYGYEQNREHIFSIDKISHERRLDEFIDKVPRFYARINDISHHDGLMYFVDNSAGKVVATDEDLNYQFEFLSKGPGPDEARHLGRLVPNNKQLVLADYLGRKFMIFNEQGELSKIISPVSHFISSSNYFIKDQQIHFYQSRSDSLKVVDFDGTIVNRIPFPWASIDLENKNIKPDISIFPYGENYLFLCHNAVPILGIIDKRGKLINKLDLSSLELLAGMINKQKSLGKNSNSSLEFFNDAKLYGNKLYVIAGTRDREGENPYYNQLLAIEITENGLKLENITKLDASRWYMNFVILPSKKKIIAFDPSVNANHIDVYSFELFNHNER